MNYVSKNQFKTKRWILVCMFSMVLIAAAAIADDPAQIAEPEAPEMAAEEPAGDVETQSAESEQAGAIQSITFKSDMRIRDALRFLAAKYQKNLVPSAKVDGVVTVSSLYDVTFEEALESILGYGFKYERDGDFIRIYTAEEYKQIKKDPERMIHHVFRLYYINADEARKLVSPLMSGDGRIETTTTADIGVPTGETISQASGGGNTTALADMLLVYDFPENIDKIAQIIAEVDVRPQQVLVEATILSATLNEGMEFGIDWRTLKGTISAVTDIAKGTPDFFGFGGTGPVTTSGGLSVGTTSDNVGAFIRAVESITDTTILANPKILAVNKQLGQVFIGTKIGYESLTSQSETSTTQQVEFLDTGTKLSFRPYIGDDGYIRMDIYPKDSTGTLKANNIPDEASTELLSNIMVKDGQTIVIGGLFRDVITTTRTQIPLLGDLPIIGALFRGTKDSKQREEVIVMLTPHIVNRSQQTNPDKAVADVERRHVGAKNAFQWIGRSRLAEDHYANAAKYYLDGNYESALNELRVAIELRPGYIEAIELKEKILQETAPGAYQDQKRNVLTRVQQIVSDNWLD